MTEPVTRHDRLTRLSLPLMAVGAVCIIVGVIIWLIPGWGRDQIPRSWLFAWIFWLGVPLGCMGVLMLWHLTAGGWGYMIRQFAETAVACLWLLLVLFIPLIFGAGHLYPWANAEGLKNPVVFHKHAWMNLGFWTGRSIVYLLIFIFLGFLMQSGSMQRPNVNIASIYKRLRNVSAGGMVVYFFIMTLGSIDWIMSREPNWYSTVFGFVVCVSQSISGCCLLIILLWFFHEQEPLSRVIHPNYLNDLGNILMTFVILWAYMSFAQFLVQWVGNKQDEIIWYIKRTDGGWRWVGAALMAFHFLVPFIILLQRPLKRKAGRLAVIAAGLFFIHIIDELYWVKPSDPHTGVWGVGHWLFTEAMNILLFVGIGGVWLGYFLWRFKDRPLLPIGDRVPVLPIDHGKGQRPVPGTLA